MEQREKINTKEILRASQMGMWCVEMEEGKPPRFYADEVMDELLGIDRDITPEERFVFHRLRIHPEDMHRATRPHSARRCRTSGPRCRLR